MTLSDACIEAVECLEMWRQSEAEKWNPDPDINGYEKISTLGTRMVINRIKRTLAENSGPHYTAEEVNKWRHNYRVTFQALHDENNRLRTLASDYMVRLAKLEYRTRKRWWQLWKK